MSSETLLFECTWGDPDGAPAPGDPGLRGAPASPTRPTSPCSPSTTSSASSGSCGLVAERLVGPRAPHAVVRARRRRHRLALLRHGARRRHRPARHHAVPVRVVAVRGGPGRPGPPAGRRRSASWPSCTTSTSAPRTSPSSSSTGPGPPPCGGIWPTQRAYYEWVAADGARSPLIERTFAWLEDHWPAAEGDAVIVLGRRPHRQHDVPRLRAGGRARLGDGGRRAPRDRPRPGWSTCTASSTTSPCRPGCPACPTSCASTTWPPPTSPPPGHEPRDLDFYTIYAALRHAIVMCRVARRSILFGEIDMPDDPDDMIMHRATLEQMLDGTYWSEAVTNPDRAPRRPADEGFTHQITDTFAVVGTSDLSWTEKICAMAAAKDGSLQLGFGLGKYTNRNVMDGYAGISRGVEQMHRAGQPAPRRRDPETTRHRDPSATRWSTPCIRCASPSTPTTPSRSPSTGCSRPSCRPPWRTAPTCARGYRVGTDLVRYHQIGVASGWVEVEGSRTEISPDTWVSTRDHSWGVRYDVGLPPRDLEPGDPLAGLSFRMIWSPHRHGSAPTAAATGCSCTTRSSRDRASPTSRSSWAGSSNPTAPSSASSTSNRSSPSIPVNRRLRGGTIDARTRRRDRCAPWRSRRCRTPASISAPGSTSASTATITASGVATCTSTASTSPTAPTPAMARRLHQIRDTVVHVVDPAGGGEGWGNCQPIITGGDDASACRPTTASCSSCVADGPYPCAATRRTNRGHDAAAGGQADGAQRSQKSPTRTRRDRGDRDPSVRRLRSVRSSNDADLPRTSRRGDGDCLARPVPPVTG